MQGTTSILRTTAVAALAFACAFAVAQDSEGPATAEELFNTAYVFMTKADEARDAGKREDAANLYRHSLASYILLSKRFPTLQPAVTRFRITYCDNQLEQILRTSNSTPTVSATSTPASTNAPVAKVDVSKLITEAKALIGEGKTQDARTRLIEALRADPDNTSVRLMIGIVQVQAQQYGDAWMVISQLVQEDPANAAAQCILGSIYLANGDIQKARAHTAQAISSRSNLPEAYYNMAQILRHIAPVDTNAVILHYRKSLEYGGRTDPVLEKLLPQKSGSVDEKP